MFAFQFPPYFVAKPANFDYIASLAEQLSAPQSRSSSAIGVGSRRSSAHHYDEVPSRA